MNIVDKIKVTLRPDTLGVAYLQLQEHGVEVETLKFNDGSIRVVLPNMPDVKDYRTLNIDCFIETGDDLFVIAQIKDIVTRKFPTINCTLKILSTPYTRYDRVMFENGSDGFGAKCFATLLNSLKFDSVMFLDSHSEVMTNLVNNSFSLDQETLILDTVDYLDCYNVIAPDKGSLKKISNPNLVFEKVRNPETGVISGVELVETVNVKPSNKYIILDDICEGGRTFIEVAKSFFNHEISDKAKLDLYITHGIFSNNAISKLVKIFNKIHVYIMKKSVYDSLTVEEQSKLNIKFLVNI